MSGPVAQCSEAVERETETRRLACQQCGDSRPFSNHCPRCGPCARKCIGRGGAGALACCILDGAEPAPEPASPPACSLCGTDECCRIKPQPAPGDPNHYQAGRIEVAVAMDLLAPSGEQWLGHALKYACRAPHKGSEIEDLRKAIWCTKHALDLGARWQTPMPPAARKVLADALMAGIPADRGGPRYEIHAATAGLICWLVTASGEAPIAQLEAALDGAK